jgi:predicted transposase YdaD
LDNSDQQPVGIKLMQLTIAAETEAIAQARQLIDQAEREASTLLARNEIIDIISTIIVYKFANFSREEVEIMLGLTLEETRIYKDLERQTTLKVIRNLLNKGQSLEYIADIVEMSVEEVRQIAQQQQ